MVMEAAIWLFCRSVKVFPNGGTSTDSIQKVTEAKGVCIKNINKSIVCLANERLLS